MPYVFVENEPIIRSYHGITVYKLYRNDYLEAGEREYCFSLSPLGTEVGDGAFDIRDIPGYDPSLPIAMNLTRMIDAGHFGPTDVLEREAGKKDERTESDGGALNICPICGNDLNADGSFTGANIPIENQIGYPFVCRNCGASGIEWSILRYNCTEIE